VAAVIDLFSRRVLGWSMSASMTVQLVTNALVMAIRRVAAKYTRTGWDTAVARRELTFEPGSRWCSLRGGPLSSRFAASSLLEKCIQRVDMVADVIVATLDNLGLQLGQSE
jgi:hypothetical protein